MKTQGEFLQNFPHRLCRGEAQFFSWNGPSHTVTRKSLQFLGGSMYFLSKHTAGRVLAVALAVSLWGFGSSALQAKEHKDHSNGCGCPAPQPPCCPAPKPVCPAPKPPCCPAPKPVCPAPPPCCPAPVLEKPCPLPPACPCCPVDPKEVRRAQRAA